MANVLVVDDQASNRELVVTLLKHAGHQPSEAADGHEALHRVRSGRPDLIICDLLMPVMDGFDFVRELRADPLIAHTRVIFYTATYLGQEARSLALACGVLEVLIKPCEPDEILRTVARALGQTAVKLPAPDASQFDRDHLRLLTDKLTLKVDELELANQRLAALIDLNLQLASERVPQELLDKVCRGAREFLGASYAVLAVRDAHAGSAIALATSGFDAAQMAQLSDINIDAGVLGQVLAKSRAQRFLNPHGDPVKAGLSESFPPMHSGLIVPIISTTEACGWILLIDKLGADGFSQEDERLASMHAAQAGRIYETGQLYLAMQRNTELLCEREAGLEKAQSLAKLAHVITRPDGSFDSWSQSLSALIGLAAAPMPASTREWLALLHPDDRDAVRAASSSADRCGIAFAADYRLLRGDGKWIYLHQETQPLPERTDSHVNAGPPQVRSTPTGEGRPRPAFGSSGHKWRWLNTFQDVTEQKVAEQKSRRVNQIFEVLSSVNALIVRVGSREELLRGACRIGGDSGAYRLAWIGMIDPTTGDGQVVAWHGGADSALTEIGFTLRDDEPRRDAPASRAVRGMAPVILNDVSADPSLAPLRDAFLAGGLRSQACFPLVVEQQAVGVLSLFSDTINAFDDQEVKLLLALAGNISFALARLQKDDRLNYLAYYDALTGLGNASLLTERLELTIAAATSAAKEPQLALALVDIDRFKEVNHQFGRHGGDSLLMQLSDRLGEGFGGRQQLARIGADQFAVLLPDVRNLADLGRRLSEQYRRWFDAPFNIGGQEIRVTAKIGVAVYPFDGLDAETLHRNAEAAVRMVTANAARVQFYDSRTSKIVAEKLAFEGQLRYALDHDEFVLHYQPKVDVDSRNLCGVEALIRWNSPTLGLVPPLRFIPLLEETGLIVEVGLWALRRAARDYSAWRSQGLAAPRIAVNVSAIQLHEADFVQTVGAILSQSGADHGIDVELTESLIMEDVESNIGKLRDLRALDVHLFIDDFGTGYSSLAYLSRLPADSLKIDRTFIMTMLDEPNNMTLVSTMISLAHSLRLKVVAEGVETEEQAKILRLLRCDQMQGYLVGHPMPFSEMSAWLSNEALKCGRQAAASQGMQCAG